MRHDRRRVLFAPLALLALTGLAGCATDLKPTANTPSRTQRPTGFYAAAHGTTPPPERDRTRALDELVRGKKHPRSPHAHPGDVSEAQLGGAVVEPQVPGENGTHPYHILQRGETLWSVAQTQHVTVDEIQKLNGFVNPATLPVGTKVLLPSTSGDGLAIDPSHSGAVASGTDNPNSLSARGVFYIVQAGDTLPKVAKANGVTQDDLRKWNAKEVAKGLPAGCTLYIPAVSERSADSLAAQPARSRLINTAAAEHAPVATFRPGTTPGTFRWPISGPVISGFGARHGRIHTGIDIAADEGTPVHAAMSGRLIFSGVMRGYGNVIILDHQNGFFSVYAHNNRNLLVREDVGHKTVKAGDVISLVGQTGNATRPHLHFEIRQFNNALDPLPLLPKPHTMPIASRKTNQPDRV